MNSILSLLIAAFDVLRQVTMFLVETLPVFKKVAGFKPFSSSSFFFFLFLFLFFSFFSFSFSFFFSFFFFFFFFFSFFFFFFFFFWHYSPLFTLASSKICFHCFRSWDSPPHGSDCRALQGSDQPDAETSTWQPTTPTKTNIDAPGEFRTRNPSKRAAADPHFRLKLHWSQNRHYTANQRLSGT